MGKYAELRKKAIPGPAPAVRAKWFNIRYIPDLATGEVLNIGVGLIDASGRVHAKLLTDFARLHCLYGARLDPEGLQFFMDLLRESLSWPDVPPCSPSPNFVFSELKYAAGDSVEAILNDFYAMTVSLEPSPPDQNPTGEDHG